MLKDDFGVSGDSMHWFTGAVEPTKAARHEKIKFSLPENILLSQIPDGNNLSEMLAKGELDAVFSATQPSAYSKYEHVTRLFPNFKEVEGDYFQRTKVFPIMHLVVLKRSVYEANPWIAKSLMKAFASSLDIAYEAIAERAALRYMMPWLEDHLQETRAVMGERYWEDGFTANKAIIDKFLQYSFEQGLAKKKFTPEDLFASNTLETFVV